MLSGGTTSWAAAKRSAERDGLDGLTLLFADVKGEDPDTYRFLEEGAANIGLPVTRIEDGRTVWEVFHEEGMIGNTRADLCSRILKRELMRRWLTENCDPANTVVILGLDSSEGDRIERTTNAHLPWVTDLPLTWKPDIWKPDAIEWCKSEGMEPPLLTRLGFAHANCGGACVKAGQGQWKKLFETFPDRYAWWEAQEERFRSERGKDVAILRDRGLARILERIGLTRAEVERVAPEDEKPYWRVTATGERVPDVLPLPLRMFRERLEANPQASLFDEGTACSCLAA